MKTMLEWKGVTVRYGQKIAAENVSAWLAGRTQNRVN